MEAGPAVNGELTGERGWIQIRSRHPVAATADRLEASLKARGILVFARIDFSADAARAGLAMRPEQLIIFGNPKAGTPLMVAAPTVGLDLPVKALIWEDAAGICWIAYNDPRYIVRRHGLASSFAENLAAVVPLIESAARE
jgi:uncharacterized protein (DUF302 family)